MAHSGATAVSEGPVATSGGGGALLDCDVVMKGGITSGVVYPGALWVLSGRYRFRDIGGASAGAIAAAIAAAAQYGDGRDDEGRLGSLKHLGETVAAQGFLAGLFQPYPAGRGPYKLLLSFVSDHHALWWRIVKVLLRMLVQVWPLVLGGVAAGWAIWKYGYGGAGAIPAIVLVALAILVLAPLWPLFRLWRVLRVEHGFGLCPGTQQGGNSSPGLLDWIHAEIQTAAGRQANDAPLTFADLEERGVRLQLMTTDLSAGRPVRLPLAEPGSPERNTDYLFRLDELEPLLPQPLYDWLADDNVARPIAGGYRQLPGAKLPIALGARLSLSFPILLSATRLHARTRLSEPPELRLFSDGGISSNFPIHFFDDWLPTRPTFGLDLIGPDPASTQDVVMAHTPYDPLPQRWTNISGLPGFGKQIFDSARNWRDTLQMELPGFRERVCHIRLTPQEGGLNLNMNATTISGLLARGRDAGQLIIDQFAWPQQQWERFRMLSSLLELNLQQAGEPATWQQYAAMLNSFDAQQYPYAQGVDAAWATAAEQQLDQLFNAAAAWGHGNSVSMTQGELPQPTPVMQVSPDV